MFLSVGDLFQEYSQRKFNMYTDMHIIFCVVPENTFFVFGLTSPTPFKYPLFLLRGRFGHFLEGHVVKSSVLTPLQH